MFLLDLHLFLGPNWLKPSLLVLSLDKTILGALAPSAVLEPAPRSGIAEEIAPGFHLQASGFLFFSLSFSAGFDSEFVFFVSPGSILMTENPRTREEENL